MRTTKKMQSLSRICGIRNFYGACCAFTLLILGASPAHSQDVLDKVSHDQINYNGESMGTTPPLFTIDGKTSIQSPEYQGEDNDMLSNVHIIDDELNDIKSIDIKQPDLKDITIIQKKGVEKVEENVSSIKIITDYEISEDDPWYSQVDLNNEKYVLNYFKMIRCDSVCIVGDRHYLYSHDSYDYYESREFGFKYPKKYYYYCPAGAEYPDSLVRLYRVDCRYERLGDYYITSEKETPLESVRSLYFYDLNAGVSIEDFYVTQTLFNDDEKYEYIRKTWEPVTTTQDYVDYYDGMVVTTKHYCTGFEIVSEDGKILQTIKFGAKAEYAGWEIIKLNDKLYLRVYRYELEGGRKHDWYRITPSSTSGLKRVDVPHGLTVMPTMAKRHETINVEVKESNQDRTVSIVGTGGQVVWQGTIHAGQKQLTVPASRLAKGVNVVNVDGSNGESVKVIVR